MAITSAITFCETLRDFRKYDIRAHKEFINLLARHEYVVIRPLDLISMQIQLATKSRR